MIHSHYNSSPCGRRRLGFTLAELLVVAGVIGLILALVVPMIRGLFSAGADVQAAGQMTAMLGAARGQAIDLQRPSALMLGVGADRFGWTGTGQPVNPRGWAVVMRHYNTYYSGGKNLPYFIPSADLAPQVLPGTMACGSIVNGSPYISGTAFADAPLAIDAGFDDFTNFAIVFNPDGTLVDQVDSGLPVMANYIVTQGGNLSFTGTTDLAYSHIAWRAIVSAADQAKIDKAAIFPQPSGTVAQMVSTVTFGVGGAQPGAASPGATGKLGVRAFTIFDYKLAKAAAKRTPSAAGAYINANGNFFCVNPYTGQVIPAE